MSQSVVKPEYGPTLAELSRPWLSRAPRWLIVGLILLVLLVAGGVIAYIVKRETRVHTVTVTEPAAFAFDYWSPLRRVKPVGDELARVEVRRDGIMLQSFAVSPLRLQRVPAAQTAGSLSVLAAGVERRLARRYDEFRLTSQNTTRVDNHPAYSFTFEADLNDRLIGGRATLVPDPDSPTHTGVLIVAITTASADWVPGDTSIGFKGPIQGPMNSFRLLD
jgi:hypothetical protein